MSFYLVYIYIYIYIKSLINWIKTCTSSQEQYIYVPATKSISVPKNVEYLPF